MSRIAPQAYHHGDVVHAVPIDLDERSWRQCWDESEVEILAPVIRLLRMRDGYADVQFVAWLFLLTCSAVARHPLPRL